MNISSGFIALFLVAILPGMIFRRFFFLGEFSKQVSVQEPILRTVIYSVKPSLFLHLTFLQLCDGILFDAESQSFFDYINNFLLPAGLKEQPEVKIDLGSRAALSRITVYIITLYIFSGIIGIALFYIIRVTVILP